jgi:imidazolonepropionase-like amidohydrolase
VKVAHARGKKATAHAHGAIGIQNAINAGVDSIEHASLADEATLQLAKKHGTWLAMDIYNGDYIEDIGTKEGWPAEYLRKNRETTDAQRAAFRRAVELGINIGFATDAGVYPHGLNARQFRKMVEYGMTPMQAIQSATGRAAVEMGRDDIGAIVPGRYADFVAVKADPLADIGVLEAIDHVMKGGVLVR